MCWGDLVNFRTILNVPNLGHLFYSLPREHIWTMLMHKILQNHLLCAFVANLKIGGIYALYPESFCDKNLAIRKVFAFCDSAPLGPEKYGRIDFSLGRWTTMGQNAPKLVLKHAKEQVELVRIFLRSLLRPQESLF